MRKGFTTGSCAAAAAKAAAVMLLRGNRMESIGIDTPAGVRYKPAIEDITIAESSVRCAVRKDAGDDPDVTDGALIYATVSFAEDGGEKEEAVEIRGGSGVGVVTRPGLDQPVGNAAINTVPREMITAEVKEVMETFDHHGTLLVEISVPGGEELAAKTFNPRLGIEGGISIIGTTGIVEPMSIRAILETIRVEISQAKAMGAQVLVASPGNYGLEFMRTRFSYDLDRAVKCSNFIGETIDMAADAGFREMLLCGHMGKLVKVSGGIMNTHSREADCRMELMAASAIRCGASRETAAHILESVSTEEAYACYLAEGIEKRCGDDLMDRIDLYLNRRAGDRLRVACMMYAGRYGLIGATPGAEEMLKKAGGVFR
ncbi:MAG: cobalt-precorrin-5B (C(1))-methyltransferase CbiD [Lachnospiraceae bacterium]|nr:cobalt-precorrin-5B (C(1))-methyltransferase CbiD [Lachnospiraceae bacterium]